MVRVLHHAEMETLGFGTSMALSMERDCDPAENVNVLRAKVLILYRPTITFARVALCAESSVGLGLSHLTNSRASRTLKTIYASTTFFMR